MARADFAAVDFKRVQVVWEGTRAYARAGVKVRHHDDRARRVFIVADERPPRFVEWVER